MKEENSLPHSFHLYPHYKPPHVSRSPQVRMSSFSWFDYATSCSCCEEDVKALLPSVLGMRTLKNLPLAELTSTPEVQLVFNRRILPIPCPNSQRFPVPCEVTVHNNQETLPRGSPTSTAF